MQVRLNPRIRFVEPDSQVSLISPAGCGRRNRLLGRVATQEFGGCRELKILMTVMVPTGKPQVLLAVSGLSNKRFEKERSFKPPMPEQLRVERCDDDRIE